MVILLINLIKCFELHPKEDDNYSLTFKSIEKTSLGKINIYESKHHFPRYITKNGKEVVLSKNIPITNELGSSQIFLINQIGDREFTLENRDDDNENSCLIYDKQKKLHFGKCSQEEAIFISNKNLVKTPGVESMKDMMVKRLINNLPDNMKDLLVIPPPGQVSENPIFIVGSKKTLNK